MCESLEIITVDLTQVLRVWLWPISVTSEIACHYSLQRAIVTAAFEAKTLLLLIMKIAVLKCVLQGSSFLKVTH